MRLWTIHPKYLDRQGLTALWREALLARAVLEGKTRGYLSHPQLERFRAHEEPLLAIGEYLNHVWKEAARRGYRFDESKTGAFGEAGMIAVTSGQVSYEWEHLLKKLFCRSPELYETHRGVKTPALHPLFISRPGGVEEWERPRGLRRQGIF